MRARSGTIYCRIGLVVAAAAVVLATWSCGEAPRPRHLAATSITDGDGAALGSEVEMTLDGSAPVALRGVVEFSISDPTIVEGRIVPGQGLVLSPKKLGQTGADVQTNDGKHHAVTLIVKTSKENAQSETIELEVGESLRLEAIDEAILDWSSSPPGAAEVMTSADGVFVIARQPGEVTLLLRTASKPRLLRLRARGCTDCVRVQVDASAGDGGRPSADAGRRVDAGR